MSYHERRDKKEKRVKKLRREKHEKKEYEGKREKREEEKDVFAKSRKTYEHEKHIENKTARISGSVFNAWSYSDYIDPYSDVEESDNDAFSEYGYFSNAKFYVVGADKVRASEKIKKVAVKAKKIIKDNPKKSIGALALLLLL